MSERKKLSKNSEQIEFYLKEKKNRIVLNLKNLKLWHNKRKIQTNKCMQTICLSTTAIPETPNQNVYLQFQPSLQLENQINTLLEFIDLLPD